MVMKVSESQPTEANEELNNPSRMPAIVYKFRVLGMALAGLAIAAVLYENSVSMYYWFWWVFSCFLWPHVAFQLAKSQSNPMLAERNNLLFDSFIAGTWTALMWFNLLPAVILWVTTTADKATSGIKNLWLHSQPVLLLGLVLGSLLTGFKFQPNTSMFVILAVLPILTVHIIFVSLETYKLIRKVQKQNITFKELSQKDTLTQLYNRRHWQHQVETMLNSENASLSLILIDIDNFKQFNDSHGHSTGDEILVAISNVIIETLPESAVAGRLGGDEFAVVIKGGLPMARNMADQIRLQVAELSHKELDDINCTVSIGLSEKEPQERMRSWFDRADKKLYSAKYAGRNQIQ